MALPAADHLAIEQLYARYSHAVDRGDGDAWAACFTADGVLAWLHITKSPVTFPTTGFYDDEVVPTTEGWRFRRRTFISDL